MWERKYVLGASGKGSEWDYVRVSQGVEFYGGDAGDC
jgi:hypothetical protein